MNVYLIVRDGKHAGRQIQLPPTQFVIGRDARCHLRPASSDVSRYHCAIAINAGQVHVRDLKSRNGTFVNDRRVTGVLRLQHGDVLQVGPLHFEVQVQHRAPGLVSASRPSDGELSWLVRNPSADEHKALDPCAGTRVFAPSDSATLAGSAIAPSNSESDAGAALGAVAGDFLRDYLTRKRRNLTA